MVFAKCANPGCAAKYRFFHEGKVIIFEAKKPWKGRPVARSNFAGVAHGLEYVWLCSECLRRFTVEYDQMRGFRVVKRSRKSQAA